MQSVKKASLFKDGVSAWGFLRHAGKTRPSTGENGFSYQGSPLKPLINARVYQRPIIGYCYVSLFEMLVKQGERPWILSFPQAVGGIA
jgi:hypothetical protein